MQRAHLLISGLVQGVFYRSNTREEASKRGLKGWVKNLPDGRVEAVFEGKREEIKSMIRWCHQGPAAAHVTDVKVEWKKPKGEKGFKIRY